MILVSYFKSFEDGIDWLFLIKSLEKLPLNHIIQVFSVNLTGKQTDLRNIRHSRSRYNSIARAMQF